jgi:hypothetical protein
MSSNAAFPLTSQLAPLLARDQSLRRAPPTRLTIGGVMLLVIGLMMIFSAMRAFRADVGGLLFHPYLAPVGLLFPLVLLYRIREFPMHCLTGLIVFAGMYGFSTLAGTGLVSENVKCAASVITIITTALLVRSRADFIAGAIGLNLAVAVLAVRGLESEIDTNVGLIVVEGSKNTFSFYALPAILLAGFVVLQLQTAKWIQALLIVCSLVAAIAIFLSANRSGYLGVAMVLFMLLMFKGHKFRNLAILSLLVAVGGAWMVYRANTVTLKYKVDQTLAGSRSDNLRRDLFLACVQIALNNPVIGVSPQNLPMFIGRRTTTVYHYDAIDSHNIFGHVMAGSGLICFGAMLYIGWTLCRHKPGTIGRESNDLAAQNAKKFLRMMIALWCVRGTFSNEILYSPPFSMAIGLAIGFAIVHNIWRSQPHSLLVPPSVGQGI